MDILPFRILSDKIIHEFQKFDASLPFRCFRVNRTSGNIQRGKKIQGTVSFVVTLHSTNDLPVARQHISALAFRTHLRRSERGMDRKSD